MKPPENIATLSASASLPSDRRPERAPPGESPARGLTGNQSPDTQPATGSSDWIQTLEKLVRLVASLRLTVVCLALGLVLVFFGTMAQDPLGLYLTQEKFFHSFFVPASAMVAAIKKTLQMVHIYLPPSTAADVLAGSKLPVFPGGYLLGGVLLINLIAGHFTRFSFTWKKIGLWAAHFGLILLLFGQLLTDLLARESVLHLREGEARNYSEVSREAELTVIDTTDKETDKVVAIPERRLRHGKEIRHPELPFVVRVREVFGNSAVELRPADATEPAAASRDIGARAIVKRLPPETDMNLRDVPSVIIELVGEQGSLGTWLVSEHIAQAQNFTFNNRTYQLGLRPLRLYKPYTIQLLNFQHDTYPGTQIPKNFSSRISLQRPGTGENREVLIYMNNPLRYAGETYYQSGFDPDNHGTILQVVHNPSWLTPYGSCILVFLGLVFQFALHLINFTFKPRPGAA